MAERHHYLPRFYLQGFADARKKIRMYRSRLGLKPVTTSITNAAVETGFYAVEGDDVDSSELERHLSQIEHQASTLLRSLIRGGRLSIDERMMFAAFLGFQIMRTPESRLESEVMFDRMEKVFYEKMTPEWARERLASTSLGPTDENVKLVMDIAQNPNAYRFYAPRNEDLRIMYNISMGLADALFQKAWLIAQSPGPAFITSDHCIVAYSAPTTPPRLTGIGVEDAELVAFPLDRHHALLMRQPGGQEGKAVVHREDVGTVNSLMAAYSHRLIFQHPSDPLIDRLLPKTPRALFVLNDEDVFDDEGKDKVRLPPIFTPHFAQDEPIEFDGPRTFTQDEIIHVMPARPEVQPWEF
jgi:hypothetical protein